MDKEKIVPVRRRGKYYLGDKVYSSVTTILNILAKPALMYWGQKVAAEIALDDPTLSVDEVRAEIQKVVSASCDRGTSVHDLAELWASDGVVPTPHGEHAGYIEGLAGWINKDDPKPISWEETVWSDEYEFAGRYDLVCEMGGKVWLIDFKTGKSIYKSVAPQLSAYKHALSEMGKQEVDNLGVVLCKEDGSFQFAEVKDCFDDFLNIKKVFEWDRRKDG